MRLFDENGAEVAGALFGPGEEARAEAVQKAEAYLDGRGASGADCDAADPLAVLGVDGLDMVAVCNEDRPLGARWRNSSTPGEVLLPERLVTIARGLRVVARETGIRQWRRAAGGGEYVLADVNMLKAVDAPLGQLRAAAWQPVFAEAEACLTAERGALR